MSVLLLTGCSTKFAYNNVNWLIYWYLDDYVELNTSQEKQFDGYLEGWMSWHKQQELPQYKAQLDEIMQDIKNGNINHQSIEKHRLIARAHWERARSHVAPELAELGATLSDEQVAELFENLEKENLEDEEEMQENSELSSEKRIKKWVKNNQKQTKNWIGKLSKKQNAFIADYYGKFESTGKFWLAYKREYQSQLKDVLNAENKNDEFKSKLQALIENPEQFRSAEFETAMDINQQTSADYMISLFEMTSDKQRRKLLGEIEDLQDDIDDLMK